VLEQLLRRPAQPFTDASALPGELRERLHSLGESVLSVAASRRASDGTTKLLLEAVDGSRVETVLMPYGSRVTVCISSQVGCAVGCGFCATGAMGFARNLLAAEIVDQLRAAASLLEHGQRITNVVYMGMGEPLLNLGSVLDSIRILTAPAGLGLGHRAISVSTVGIPNGIVRLARAEPQVNLALSLHAADDETRAVLIPQGFRHPLAEILEAAWEHFTLTGRKLLVEYVLLAGVNDGIDDARRLAALLRGHVVTVNLLAWNPACPEEVQRVGPDRRRAPGTAARSGSRQVLEKAQGGPGASGDAATPTRLRGARRFEPSSPPAIAAFRAALRAANIEAVVRQSKGTGIDAACGQLGGGERSYRSE
jgi:23S rRNA (adenine2503-C2)-methyltransferase